MHTVRVEDVQEQCVRSVVVHMHNEENKVGPDSRQVTGGALNGGGDSLT